VALVAELTDEERMAAKDPGLVTERNHDRHGLNER
jgi:hypothetical protein